MMRWVFLSLVFFSTAGLAKTERAVFAGGCFWCVEADFDKVHGVLSTRSGFDGGVVKDPTYALVSAGKTRYIESVEVDYDPDLVSYERLVKYFMHHIDPSDAGGQFCDRGNSYRSAIFYLNEQQKKTAKAVLAELKKDLPNIVTTVTASTHFYAAEDYHQNYYQKNPARYKYYRWKCGRDKRVKEVWGHVH